MFHKSIFLFLTTISLFFFSCSKNNQQSKLENQSKSDSKTCEKIVAFGDINICLPEVDGMTECYNIPIVKTLTDKFEYKGNTVLAFYLNNKTYKEVNKLDQIVYDDYFKIYATDNLKNVKFGQAELDQGANMFEGSFLKENWDKIKGKILKDHNNISIGRPVLIESYSPHKKIKTFVIIAKYEMNGYENVMLGTLNLILIKNRIINLAYYRKYEDEESIKKTRAKNDYIALLFFDEN